MLETGAIGNGLTDSPKSYILLDGSRERILVSFELHVTATAEIGESVRRGMIARRILDGIVRNVYKNDPSKLAAWSSASHIEKGPMKKEPTP